MSNASTDAVLDTIRAADPDVASLIEAEGERQESTIELIASENHVSPAVTHAMGTCLTNKYAEGYPGARYYGGCEFHDRVENLARDRAGELFGCRHANVQPHSGAQANAAAFLALLKPGETFAALELSDGGHLSHGLKVNMSGKWFNPVFYPLHYDESHAEFERIDYDAMREVVLEHKPKLLMCGYSAYPRVIDFEKFRAAADEVGAILLADVAPRGGLILTDDDELAKKIDRAVFPGTQGGPLMHIIAAKAVAFGEALRPEFRTYARNIKANARALAAALTEQGFRITSGGTDNHLMLVDLRARDAELTGADAEKWLEAAGIITNKNGVPRDPRPPRVTSGLRLGTPAVTTRGFTENEMRQVARWIDEVLAARGDEGETARVRAEVRELCARFSLPGAASVAT